MANRMQGRWGETGLAFAVSVLAVSPVQASAPHDKAIGVQTYQKSKGAVDAETKTQADQGEATPLPPLVLPPEAARQQGDAGKHGENSEQEGTEFWPTFLGYKFKITDSLIALSTLALTVFTGLLWRSTEKLWSAGEKQIALVKRSTDLTQLALEAAETPYLVPIVRVYDEKVDPPPPSPAMQPLASLRFENCGRSPATVLEIRVDTGGSKHTPNPAHFPPLQTNLMHSYILPQGRESEPMRFTVGSFGDWTPANHQEVAWINGHVRYADVFGNQFLTRFCYYRQGYGQRWYAQGGPGHNGRHRLTGDDLIVAMARDRGEYLNGPFPGD